MRTMLFANFEQSVLNVTVPGQGVWSVNSTIRKGLKWSNLDPGESIKLSNVEGDNTANAIVLDTKIMRFCDLRLTPAILALYHDPKGRRYTGLLRIMKACYDGFLSEEIVTVVTYRLADAPET